MGKLAVTEFISLDGVIQAPGGGEQYEHAGWSFKFNRGDEGNKFKVDELAAADAQLLGRVTYQGFAAAWPSMNDDEFGKKMNGMPKYVVSRTLSDKDASWSNSTVIGLRRHCHPPPEGRGRRLHLRERQRHPGARHAGGGPGR